MCAFATALALALASAPGADARGDVRWFVGPTALELGGGRVRCVVPAGAALAAGPAARAILEVVAHASDGSELALISPVAPARTWYVVVAWREGARPEAPAPADGVARDGALVWLERPRTDGRTGRTSWALAGPGVGGPSVNQHVLLPGPGGGVELTLVAPVEELSEGRAQLERIADGILVTEPAGARVRPGR